MQKQGFVPRGKEAVLLAKSDPKLVAFDYQWYEGHYENSPLLFAFVYFDDSNRARIMMFHRGGKNSDVADTATRAFSVKIKAFFLSSGL